MNRLRRVLLSRVGYQDAWYNGVVLNFVDQDGRLENSILSLPNGEGKTTLLSLIFSCLVPDQRRFVQHLRKPDHHFRDYVSEQPGVICMEMQRPTTSNDLFGGDDPNDRLVLGQVVCRRPGQQQLYRKFFSFTPSPDLDWERLPFQGLSSGAALKSLDDINHWLGQTNHRHPGGFQLFHDQGSWTDHLDEEGVDHWLLDRQVDFCGEEGGIDVFLSFRSEGDFLRRFFSMVMSREDTNQTRRILLEALEKQADRPRTQQRVGLLQELETKFGKFRESAHRREDAADGLRQAKRRLNGLAMALESRQRSLEARQSEQDSLLEEQKETHRRMVVEREGLAGQLEAVTDRVFALEIQRAEDDLARAQQDQIEAEQDQNRLRAARSLGELRETQAQIEPIQHSIRLANTDIEPAEREAQDAGTAWALRLEQERTRALSRAGEAVSLSKRRSTEKAELESRLKGLDADIGRRSVELGRVRARLDAYEKAWVRLAERRYLDEEETVCAARDRWKDRATDTDGKREENRTKPRWAVIA